MPRSPHFVLVPAPVGQGCLAYASVPAANWSTMQLTKCSPARLRLCCGGGAHARPPCLPPTPQACNPPVKGAVRSARLLLSAASPPVSHAPGLTASYSFEPLSNLVYTRDQQVNFLGPGARCSRCSHTEGPRHLAPSPTPSHPPPSGDYHVPRPRHGAVAQPAAQPGGVAHEVLPAEAGWV